MTTALKCDGRAAVRKTRAAEDQAALVQGLGWFPWMARAGLVARGVIYLLLAYIAVDIALRGSSPAAASGAGALQAVAMQPAGPALLGVLAGGLAAYAAWRLVQAVTGKEKPGRTRGIAVRAGWTVIGAIYVGLCVRAVELLAGSGSGSGGGGHPQAWAARVLRWPAGPELLGAVGVGVLVGGISLAGWGLLHDYSRELRLQQLARGWRVAVRALGGGGEVARGFLFGLVGVYALGAAIENQPAKAKTVDLALRSLARQSYGAALIGVIAFGLLCFALYSFAEARLRKL